MEQSHRSAVQEVVTSLTFHQESDSNRKYIHHRIRQLACVLIMWILFNRSGAKSSILLECTYILYFLMVNSERDREFGGEAEEEQIYLCLSPNCGE